MSMSKHPIAEEELMAYLDGELSLDRAATAAEHLEKCRECQNVAGDLQSVSRRLMVWQVEPSEDSRIAPSVAAALEQRGQAEEKPATRGGLSWRKGFQMPRVPRWVWSSGIAVASLAMLLFMFGVLFFSTNHSPMQYVNMDLAHKKMARQRAAFPPLPEPEAASTIVTKTRNNLDDGRPAPGGEHEIGSSADPAGPMNVRIARITLPTQILEQP